MNLAKIPQLFLFAGTALLASCGGKDKSSPTATPEGDAASIETLWVADQFTGVLGSWTRMQQRNLITATTVATQGLFLRQGEGIMVEIYSGVSEIVTHRKNEHGGVIELEPGVGNLLTITQEFDEDGSSLGEPKRTVERFDAESQEVEGNIFFVYRWLDGGRLDLVEVYPEGEDQPVDADTLLGKVADAAAFKSLRWVDEEGLLPEDPVFVNHAELKQLAGSLKDFSADPETAFGEVSAALDRRWKELPDDAIPERLGDVGILTSAYRFGLVFREAMIDAGYNPYFGSFAFAKAKLQEMNEPDLDEDEAAELKAMQAQFDPYAEFFEGSLRTLAESDGVPAELPEYVTEVDLQE